jgi:hypothetical protein
MHPTDILNFLKSIKDNVRNVEELLAAIRTENQRAEAYGQVHIPELMEVSAYQWQLEQLEMKLKAPSLIKISFSEESRQEGGEKKLEEKAEELLLGILMHLISRNDMFQDEEGKRFKLIL